MGCTGGSYETPWQTPNFGKAPAPGRPLAETWPYLSLGGPETERFFKLRGALATELQEERTRRAKINSQYRTSVALVEQAEENPGARLSERAHGSRLFDRSLDFETYRPDNPEKFPSALLYRESLESDEQSGLELSETSEESQRTSGRGNPLLETSRLAPYKKRPSGLEPAWPSWMRADSRLFPISREPGRSKGKPRPLLLPDAGQRYRLSPLSRSLQKENGLDSTHVSMSTGTSGLDKSDNSSGIFVDTSRAPLFSSGTEVLSTGQSSSIDSLGNILESIPSTSRDTRLSLTPMNLSGQISNEDWQTASLKTLNTLDGSLIGRLEDSGIPRGSYGRAFTRQTYRGHNVYPLFNESSVAL